MFIGYWSCGAMTAEEVGTVRAVVVGASAVVTTLRITEAAAEVMVVVVGPFAGQVE